MVPLLVLPFPVGSLSYLLGGADFSYFISFIIAFVLTTALRSMRKGPA